MISNEATPTRLDEPPEDWPSGVASAGTHDVKCGSGN
jgi:hypothetical protein